jgi:hypothetical protein
MRISSSVTVVASKEESDGRKGRAIEKVCRFVYLNNFSQLLTNSQLERASAILHLYI